MIRGASALSWRATLAAIEGDASNHLPTLIEGSPLSEEARLALSYFFAAMAVRTPDFIQSIQRANGQLLKRVSQIMLSTPEQAMKALRAKPANFEKSDAELFDEALRLVVIRPGFRRHSRPSLRVAPFKLYRGQ
ncbi:DUF4238 domain-containing protein, partial [Xanthomonas citri]